MNPYGSPWSELDTWLNHLAITPDSSIVIGACMDRTIRLWNLQTAQPLCPPLKGHSNSVRCVAVTNNGSRMLSGGDEGAVRLWDLNNPTAPIKSWGAHKGAVRCIAISPDSTLAASGGDDGMVRIWDLVGAAPTGNGMIHHKFPVACLTFSSKSNILASGDEDGKLIIWVCQPPVLKMKTQLKTPNGAPITGMIALPGTDEIVTSCNDISIRKWDVAAATAVGNAWNGHTDSVRCIGLIKDKVISGSSDSTLRVWDASNNSQIGDAWMGPQGTIETLATSPNGKFVVSAGASEMWSWELPA